MSQSELVDQRFVKRWGRRYVEIYQRQGEKAAREWLMDFIKDKQILARVMAAVREGDIA